LLIAQTLIREDLYISPQHFDEVTGGRENISPQHFIAVNGGSEEEVEAASTTNTTRLPLDSDGLFLLKILLTETSKKVACHWHPVVVTIVCILCFRKDIKTVSYGGDHTKGLYLCTA